MLVYLVPRQVSLFICAFSHIFKVHPCISKLEERKGVPTGEDFGAYSGGVGEVGAGGVLLVAGGAAEAAVAAAVLAAAVARNLTAVHPQRLQPRLQLLVGAAVLLDACATKCS